jgi:hypothetical protein
VMAFHMLTGSLPFTASTLAKLLRMQVAQNPPDIRNARTDIDEGFARLIDSWLSKEADDRYSDWEEIRNTLKPVSKQLQFVLDPNELAVMIRFHDTSYQHSANLINIMKRVLRDEGINHQIEIHRGEYKSA